MDSTLRWHIKVKPNTQTHQREDMETAVVVVVVEATDLHLQHLSLLMALHLVDPVVDIRDNKCDL